MKRILMALFIGELSWKRLFRSLVLIPIGVAVGLLIIAVFFADRAIFRPPSSSYKDTAEIIKVPTRTGEPISAKYYENESAEYTLIFSHGNAEDIGMIEPMAWRFRDIGLNVLTYDYPGYGTSDGSASEEKAYESIDAAYDYLLKEKRVEPERIILYGRSLGGAVAVDLASRRPVAGLIVESTFTSAFRVITRYQILPFDKFENVKKIADVRCPILIIHGTDDWTIPAYHGQRLFQTANEPKEMLWNKGAGHNDAAYRNEKLYLDRIKSLVQSLDEK